MSTPVSPSFKIVGGDGREYGPIDLETLQQWAREGRVAGQTQVWDSRTGNWQPAAQIAELAAIFPTPAVPAGTTPVPDAAAPGVELADQILQRGYTIEIGKWFNEGWAFFKANLGFALGACWMVFGLCIVAAIIGMIPFVGGLVQMAFSIIVQPMLIGGLWYVLIQRRRGQPAAIGDIFDGFKLFFAQGILVNLIIGLMIVGTALPGGVVVIIGVILIQVASSSHVLGVFLIALGTLLAMVPIFYLSICYAFAMPLVVDRRMQFWAAMETSRRVISRHWFTWLGFRLVVGLMVLLGGLACCVGFVFTSPLGFCISVIAYEGIFGPPDASGDAPRQQHL